MKKKKLHYFVLFSGGLDSTFLVWKLLKAGHKITTFYVSILNNDIKTKIEKAHRTLLLEKFKNEFGHDKIVDSYGDYEIRLDYTLLIMKDMERFNHNFGCLPQHYHALTM